MFILIIFRMLADDNIEDEDGDFRSKDDRDHRYISEQEKNESFLEFGTQKFPWPISYEIVSVVENFEFPLLFAFIAINFLTFYHIAADFRKK